MDESTRSTKRRSDGRPWPGRSAGSLAAEAAFRDRLAELGAELLESAWLGSKAPHRAVCAAGHDCWPTPNKVQNGRGACEKCGIAARHEKTNLPRMADAERRFRALLDELGVVLLEPYQGVRHRLRARCPEGHEFNVWPVSNRPVVCKTCGRKDQVAAKAKFREGLDSLGVVLMEPGWLGVHQQHRVRCAAGHDYKVWPVSVMAGGGSCQQCKGRGPVAEAAFRARVVELGGTPLYGRWLGVNKGHLVRCANGHESSPRPSNVRRGGGLCKKCVALDRIERNRTKAEAAFLARLAELGAAPLYEKWLGVRRKHRVRCANGHDDCYPIVSNVLNGAGVCLTCAGNNPAAAEANFRARLLELGATPLFEKWLGNHEPHPARCAAGHDCQPIPAGVQQGEGACGKCRGKFWDAFYVVENEDERRVKFGVTSGDARPRLADHRVAGYRTVVRLLTGLPDGAAPGAERAVKAALALAGEKPVRGMEYFDASCLGLILDVADSWLARDAGTEDYAADSNGQLALFAA